MQVMVEEVTTLVVGRGQGGCTRTWRLSDGSTFILTTWIEPTAFSKLLGNDMAQLNPTLTLNHIDEIRCDKVMVNYGWAFRRDQG